MGDNNDQISRYYFESTTTKLERTIEKLWLTVILLILLLVGTNAAWVYYESTMEDTIMTQEAEVETSGGDAYVNNGGDMIYGEDKSKTDSAETE